MIGRQRGVPRRHRSDQAATTAGTSSWWPPRSGWPRLAAIGLGVVYWRGGQPQAEGALLAVGAGGLAVGFITWAHRLLPQGPEIEERRGLLGRHRPASGEFDADLSRGGVITRRRLILRSLGAAAVAFGAALLFPLRSLGPRPSDAELDATPWTPGKRVVTADGTPVRAADVPLGGLVTVFPEGAVNSETGRPCWSGSTPA